MEPCKRSFPKPAVFFTQRKQVCQQNKFFLKSNFFIDSKLFCRFSDPSRNLPGLNSGKFRISLIFYPCDQMQNFIQPGNF